VLVRHLPRSASCTYFYTPVAHYDVFRCGRCLSVHGSRAQRSQPPCLQQCGGCAALRRMQMQFVCDAHFDCETLRSYHHSCHSARLIASTSMTLKTLRRHTQRRDNCGRCAHNAKSTDDTSTSTGCSKQIVATPQGSTLTATGGRQRPAHTSPPTVRQHPMETQPRQSR
jgi:hypothetical protein